MHTQGIVPYYVFVINFLSVFTAQLFKIAFAALIFYYLYLYNQIGLTELSPHTPSEIHNF